MTVERQKRVAKIWLGIGVVCLLMIAAPFVLTIDISSGGGALLFVGGVGVLVSAIVARIYFKRAATLGQMLSKENILAEWRGQGTETLISRQGLLTNNILYPFKDMTCELTKVARKPDKLTFTFEVSSHSRKISTVEVPIPQGQAARAEEVVSTLKRTVLS